MRASGQPTLPVVGLQQLNDFAESYSAANLDLEVANTRRSQLAQTRGRKVSAALARGGRRSPGTAAPHTKRPRARGEARAPFHSTYAEDGLVGEANTSTYLSPSCYCAVLARLVKTLSKKFSQLGGAWAARRRDPCPAIDGHHGHHGHPSGETLKKKILAARWGRSRLSAAIGRPCSMPAGAGSGRGVSF